MQWRDRTLRGVRQAAFTLTWGIQVVLYPIYVLFQSGRLVGQKIRAAVNRFVPLLEAVKDDNFDPAVGVPPLDADAPFHHVLSYLETFELPIIISPSALPGSPNPKLLKGHHADTDTELESETAIANTLLDHLNVASSSARSDHHALATPYQKGTHETSDSMALTHQSFSGSGMQAASLNPVSENMAICDVEKHPIYLTQVIRGFVSVLETRRLALVDTQNQVLDILTQEQQLRLHERIVFEVASYYRSHKLQLNAQLQIQHRRSLPEVSGRGAWRFLPPLQTKTTMAPPVRLFRKLMGWMQTSPIAVSANMFQEAALVPFENQHGIPLQSPMSDMGPSPTIASGPPMASRSHFWHGLLQSVGLSSGESTQPPPEQLSAPQLSQHEQPISDTTQWFDPDHQGSRGGWLNANQFTQARRQAERFFSMPSLPFRNRWMPNWEERIQGSDSIVDSPVQPTLPDEARGNGAIASVAQGAIASGSTQKTPQPGQTRMNPSQIPPRMSPQMSPDVTTSVTASVNAADDSLLSPLQGVLRDKPGDLFASIDPAEREGGLSTTLVDTKATLVGYVKHPLEQVLEWIDLGMLWIEGVTAKTWYWLRTILKLD